MGEFGDWYVEWRVRENAASYFGRRLRRVRAVHAAELPLVRAADAEGRIPDAVWKNLTALDVLVRGIQGDNGDTREKYFAVEASAVIDASDVQHAEERAGYLRDVGYDVAPWVAGRRILDAAQTLADERGVGVIILDPPSGA